MVNQPKEDKSGVLPLLQQISPLQINQNYNKLRLFNNTAYKIKINESILTF